MDHLCIDCKAKPITRPDDGRCDACSSQFAAIVGPRCDACGVSIPRSTGPRCSRCAPALSPDEFWSASAIRCPACGHLMVGYHHLYEYVETAEVSCASCDHEFEVEVHRTLSFTSPPRLRSKESHG